MSQQDLLYQYQKISQKIKNKKKQRQFLKLRKPMFDFIKNIATTNKGLSQTSKNYKQSLKFLLCSNHNYRGIKKVAKDINQTRPTPNVLIDQCPIRDEDLAKRVTLILNKTAPINTKRILFVGDDDLTSALLMQIAHPKKITVIDIDQRILDTISCWKGKNKPRLIRDNIIYIITGKNIDQLENKKYDIFVTDPPYTETGYKYFLSYALKHLDLHGRGFIAVPHMNLEQWTDELLFAVENFLLKQGCLIEELIPSFSLYQHEEGVISSMLIIKKISTSKISSRNLKKLNPLKVYTLNTNPNKLDNIVRF